MTHVGSLYWQAPEMLNGEHYTERGPTRARARRAGVGPPAPRLTDDRGCVKNRNTTRKD